VKKKPTDKIITAEKDIPITDFFNTHARLRSKCLKKAKQKRKVVRTPYGS
jgi:hypothetical protein